MKHLMARGLLLLSTVTSVGCGSKHESASMIETDTKPSSVIVPESITDTSVIVPMEPLADVESAFALLIDRRIDCGRSPWSCEPERIAVEGTDVYETLTDLMADRVANGVVASQSGGLRYRIDHVNLTDDDSATVRVCFTDDTVLVQSVPPSLEGEIPPIIVDDSLVSSVTDWDLRRVGGEWLWSAERPLNWSVGEDLCAV
jgi:hypothetical protein